MNFLETIAISGSAVAMRIEVSELKHNQTLDERYEHFKVLLDQQKATPPDLATPPKEGESEVK